MKIQSAQRLLTRRNALKLVATGTVGALIDGYWIEPQWLSITRQDVVCKKLSPHLDRLKIALLADFHFQPGRSEELVDQVVAQVQTEKPDLIALAGDFINQDPQVVIPLLERLGEMTATHGIFAVMGNHDGWAGHANTLRRQFEKAGISFLINQHTQLTIGGELLAVAGTDFVWLGRPDPEKTLKGIGADTPILALVHEPDYFDTMISHREILLQVSGHTHGGQCRVPIVGYAPLTPKYGKKYIYGSYQNQGSNLFVTRGVGTTGPRVRFACPPELVVLTLRAPFFA